MSWCWAGWADCCALVEDRHSGDALTWPKSSEKGKGVAMGAVQYICVETSHVLAWGEARLLGLSKK